MLLDVLYSHLQFVGEPHIVLVAEGVHVSLERGVARHGQEVVAKALPWPLAHRQLPWRPSLGVVLYLGQRVVGRPIFTDHQTPVGMGLAGKRFELLTDVFAAVVAAHEDGNRGLSGTLRGQNAQWISERGVGM